MVRFANPDYAWVFVTKCCRRRDDKACNEGVPQAYSCSTPRSPRRHNTVSVDDCSTAVDNLCITRVKAESGSLNGPVDERDGCREPGRPLQDPGVHRRLDLLQDDRAHCGKILLQLHGRCPSKSDDTDAGDHPREVDVHRQQCDHRGATGVCFVSTMEVDSSW